MLIVVVLIIITFMVFIASYIIFYLSLYRYANKEFVLNNDINNKVTEGKRKMPKPRVGWLKNNAKEVDILSDDNIRLHGYIVNNTSRDWIVLVHGFSTNHEYMINRGYKFYNMGFNVLLVDLRAHGNSEGKYITMGIKDCHDIVRWCNYITKKEHAKSIGLFGISMGAATVMMASNLDLPRTTKYVIEDCGYTSVWEELKYQLNNIFHLPAFPFLTIANMFAKRVAGFDFKEISSTKSLSKTPLPVLMIHGTNDTFVPYYMLDKNYKACNSTKEKFIVKDANHTEAEDLDYDNYWKTIKEFVYKYK